MPLAIRHNGAFIVDARTLDHLIQTACPGDTRPVQDYLSDILPASRAIPRMALLLTRGGVAAYRGFTFTDGRPGFAVRLGVAC